MLYKIPIPIPTPEGIMFIPKVATSLTIPYSTWAYCKELEPDPEDEEGKEYGWWCFTSDETQRQEEQNLYCFAICDMETCDLMMQDFIDSYSVEAEAGSAPMQAEGGQL
jgi:hypothetical protein